MVKVEIVRKFKSWLGLGPSFESTIASVNPSNSENAIKCTGLFGFEELKEPNGLYLFQKNAYRKAEVLMQEIKNEEHKCNLVMVCDEVLDTLYRVQTVANFIRLVLPKKGFGVVAKRVYFDSKRFIDRLYNDREFYYFFKKATKDKHEVLEREPIDTYALDKFLRVSENSHSILDKRKKRIAELEWDLAVGFYSPQTPDILLSRLLHERSELAKSRGFSAYSDFAVAGSVAGTPDFVLQFLFKLNELVKTEVNRDLQDVIQDKKFRCIMKALKYLISKSEKKFFHTESCLKDYFSLDACMDGLKLILISLYDIILEIVEDKDITKGELWHSDVKKYCVQEGNEILGHIYFDIFARPGKSRGTFLIQSGRLCENGTYQRPIVVISLSFPNPAISEPLLLNVSDVDILFKEMGSAMFYILEEKKYRLNCGAGCAYDLVYVPYYLMSYFAYDSRVLRKFAKHYQTGEVIPDDLIEKLRNCKKKYCIHKTPMLVFDAVLDQVCHAHLPECFSSMLISQRFHRVRNKLFGSSSKPLTFGQERRCIDVVYKSRALNYYVLMSKAIASLIWQKYFKNDPLSQTAGEQYIYEFLEQSSLKPARSLVESYLRMKLTPECLSNAFAEQFLSPM